MTCSRASRRQALRVAMLGAVSGLAACAEARLPAPPETAVADVRVLGIPNARFWLDRGNEALIEEAVQAEARAVAADPAARTAPVSFLAVSGGGDKGAFGAGLLCGWTEAGNRPAFRLVTGVSTGALIAPFAYLGPSRDADLRAVYTQVSPDDIYSARSMLAAVTSDAMSDTTPLFRLISKHVDDPMVADIAREYGRGRLLLIGTTNIDLQRPVLWNIGAIAASSKPGSVDLIRKVLLASAAIPGAFPPVLIDVESGGRTYQEMHVDGGAIGQMFLYPPSLNLGEETRRRGIHRQRTAYLIRNDRLDPRWADTNRQFLSIAQRAIDTMIHSSGVNDVYRIYATTQRDGVAFRLAYIGSDFPESQHAPFDRAFMNALFNDAYEKARNGYPWATVPPGFRPAG
ncbi:MAG: patatin-like phospholipase family protein [Proteobacteria bacterium]|nr:patatin-like phospholipase family protein [Pseudomonadota bacterium]